MTTRDAIFSEKGVGTEQDNGSEWDFHGAVTNPHLHALHPYPARFIPQIPRKAILTWSKTGDLVLDPFCGCGTTILESILLGRNAIGVDNNDVATLISQAKSLKYQKGDLDLLFEFIRSFDNIGDDKELDYYIPKYKSRDYWFDHDAIYDLARIKYKINQIPFPAHVLAEAVFSSIIVRISYQDSDTRYSRKPYNYVPGSAIKIFLEKLKDTIMRTSEIIDLPKGNANIFHADSRGLDFIRNSTVDLIVTSPPYLNAYDYHKYHRQRLHWIDGDFNFARITEIGKHDFFTRPNSTPNQYFIDMEKCFETWSRVLKMHGKILLVVGDAIVSGKPVCVASEFVEIASKYDLLNQHWWIRKLDTNKKSFNQKARIMQEHVLLFEKI